MKHLMSILIIKTSLDFMAHLHRSLNFMNNTEGESEGIHAQLGTVQIQKY